MLGTVFDKSEVISAIKQYFYSINYPKYEEELCNLEMKTLFDKIPTQKSFFSDLYVSPSRSPFIKESIAIIYSGPSLDEIINSIEEANLSFEDFKVFYIKTEDRDVEYKDWLNVVRRLGDAISGQANIHYPKVNLGVTKFNGEWIFGAYEKNDNKWLEHDKKPFTYCHSMSVRVSRAVVNIAVGNNLDATLIDPCCGVGTVVLEALSQGINTKGYEINRAIANNAKRNLEFFGYENVITNADMHTIQDHYDIAIIDIPYGVFVSVTLDQQRAIMQTARRIADKLVIITFENLDQHLLDSGFEILDQCQVTKGKFIRFISVCK